MPNHCLKLIEMLKAYRTLSATGILGTCFSRMDSQSWRSALDGAYACILQESGAVGVVFEYQLVAETDCLLVEPE